MREYDEQTSLAGTLLPLVAGALARTEHLLAKAEQWLRPADGLDYMVRRLLVPVRFEEETRAAVYKNTPIRRSELSGDIQSAIGQHLRTQYGLDRSLPERLANLLREFERQNNRSGATARDRFASAT
jgi:hypothetical protein